MSDLLQVDTGTSVTVSVIFEYNGATKDLDSGVPVVTLTKPDGTAGPASGTVTHVGAVDSGQYSFVVAAQAVPTWLDYAAVGNVGGQPQTLTGTVEWIGQPLFNLSRFRAMRVSGQTPFSLTAVPLFTDRQLMDTRTAVLEEFTTILGFSPVQRFAREVLDVVGYGGVVRLEHTPARSLVSVKVAGVAQSLTAYSLHPAGLLRPASGYAYGTAMPSGLSNIAVEYVHGAARPPGRCSDMSMLYAAAMLNPSGFSSASTVSMPDGSTYSYEPSEVGRGGFQRYTGIRDVDRWLNTHRSVAGVA